jgi:hypothetical protein
MRRRLVVGGAEGFRFLFAQKVNNTGRAMGAVEFWVAADQTFFTQEIAVFKADIRRFPVRVVFACSHNASAVLLLDGDL